MATAYTPLLGLALPVTGELTGTWGTTVNNSITSLLDTAVAGVTTLSSDADVTLTTTEGASNQARAALINWTASNAVTRYITAPAQNKIYGIIHDGGAGALVIRGVGPTAGVSFAQGDKGFVAWDGSDFVKLAVETTILTGKTINSSTLNSPTIASSTQSGTIDQTGSVKAGITAMGALNIDCSAGNYFTKTIAGNSTFTVSSVPSSRVYAFTLELTHTSGTVTWFSGVVWPGGTAPTLTTGKVHLFTFVTDDGGTSWRGAFQLNYST